MPCNNTTGRLADVQDGLLTPGSRAVAAAGTPSEPLAAAVVAAVGVTVLMAMVLTGVVLTGTVLRGTALVLERLLVLIDEPVPACPADVHPAINSAKSGRATAHADRERRRSEVLICRHGSTAGRGADLACAIHERSRSAARPIRQCPAPAPNPRRSTNRVPALHDGLMLITGRIRLFLITILTTSGVLHFLQPGPFVSIVPKMLPKRRELVAISGAAELLCAGLLAVPRTRSVGGPLTAALFAAVLPANVSMALRSESRPGWYRVLLWVRLPLQIPLVLWSIRIGREAAEHRR